MVRYIRLSARGRKLAPWGEKCVMLDMAHNHPGRTYRVKNLKTSEIVCRKGMTWYSSDEEEIGRKSVKVTTPPERPNESNS